MTDKLDFNDISDDPRMTFVCLEGKFRVELERKAQGTFDGGPSDFDYRTYMNKTQAAAEALNLDLISFRDMPHISDDAIEVHSKYLQFRQKMDRFGIKTQIDYLSKNNIKRLQLNDSDKSKLRHYVTQIKNALDESLLPSDKKEALFDKINAFLEELDRDRTTAQAYADLVISFASTVGTFFREIEPAWKWFCKGAELVGSKTEEQIKQLPTHSPRRQIEGPKNALPEPRQNQRRQSSTDDDIPD